MLCQVLECRLEQARPLALFLKAQMGHVQVRPTAKTRERETEETIREGVVQQSRTRFTTEPRGRENAHARERRV